MPTLPTDSPGQLVPITADQITAMALNAAGVEDGSHVRYNFAPDGAG